MNNKSEEKTQDHLKLKKDKKRAIKKFVPRGFAFAIRERNNGKERDPRS